jgi:D-amino peptidase
MRVLISADGEGISGITSTDELLFGKPEYERFRQFMTDDVNAAINGAVAAGATEVIVNDSHWTMTNILPERLDPRADLIKGFHKHLCMVEGVQTGVDAVFFVGYHAMTGHSDGVANETIIGREMIETRMNGQPVGELEINAALCGHFDAPVVLVTGDDALENEARSTLGEDVECAVTKYALDRWTARCVALERSREAIKSQASRALSRLDGFAPHKLEGPVTLEVEFTSTSEALWASLVPGTQRKNPRTVSYTADNIVDAWKGFFAALLLGWSASDEVYG